jgi:hypothetical protein
MNFTKVSLFGFLFLCLTLASNLVLSGCSGCNRPEPNFEGVLMESCGKNGLSDFKVVSGSQGPLGPCSELYQIPMFEQKSDVDEFGITAKDGGYFTVDPSYSYEAIRGKGPEICFNYKHVGPSDVNGFMDNIEKMILNPLVMNAYREEARAFTTDSLYKHMAKFEQRVESRLKTTDFNGKFFNLLTLTSGLKPPKTMIDAIEKRNQTQVLTDQMKNELELAKMRLEKAKIEAETDRVKSSGLTKEVLHEKWIEAIRNTNNKVIITDGKSPVIVN